MLITTPHGSARYKSKPSSVDGPYGLERGPNAPINIAAVASADMPNHLKRFRVKASIVVRGELPNVELIRANEGAAPAPQETCLRRASDPSIGSAS